jgi:hypothetical protein
VSPAIRRLWGVLSVIAMVAALYWPTAASDSAAWADFDNRSSIHGYLILLMCVAFLYMRRDELVGPLPRISAADIGTPLRHARDPQLRLGLGPSRRYSNGASDAASNHSLG